MGFEYANNTNLVPENASDSLAADCELFRKS